MSDWGPFSLAGKSAVVTGGGRGIGAGIVHRLAEAGAAVLVVDRDGSTAEGVAAEVVAAGGRSAGLEVDVTDDGAAQEVVRRCVAEFGSLDVLVNNAAVFPYQSVLELDRATYDLTLEVNLRSLVFACQAAVTQMLEQPDKGTIVNISSIDAVRPAAVGLAVYDASKAAVAMFSKSLAYEFGPRGIRVNNVGPGMVETPGTLGARSTWAPSEEAMEERQRRFVQKRVPLRRKGTPADIANAVLFLASPASGYVTGQSIYVDGGALLT